MDEAGFYLLPCVVRTWSPIGETPVLTTPCKYDHLSVAGALTREGRVLMKVLDRTFTGEDSVEFLRHILRQIKGKIIVIWDGAKIHHGEAVKDFLKSGASRRLRLIRLPAYAPELNPVEGLWCWLKRALGNTCCESLAGLRDELLIVLARLRRRSEVLEACFQKAGLLI